MINALPSSLANELERMERAISLWPVQVSMDNAVKWILQFDADDYTLALRIIENIDLLAQRDVRAAFEVAQAKLQRAAAEKGAPINGKNTLYAGVGQAAKSGAVMAYHYRLTAELSEKNFFVQDEETEIDFSDIENIVLLDDIIGTGKSVIKDVSRIAEEVHALAKPRNMYVLTVAGYEAGIKGVVDETGATVISALEYSSKDTVNDFDAAFYTGLPMSERSRTLERIKRYNRIASRSDLGFGGLGGLLVFDHNTPNTSLPLIWGSGNGWIPLFPRVGRVHGTAKVLKSLEKERLSESSVSPAASPSRPSKSNAILTIFVEGKFDELFVDVMRSRLELATKLGVKDVSAVALGGLAQSSRLVDLLSESRKFAVFVLDGDAHSRKMFARVGSIDKNRTIYLRPTFSAMFDFRRVFADSERFRGLPDQNVDPNDERWLQEFEVAVIKRRPLSASSEKLAQMIEEYLDRDKYSAFVEELSAIVDQVFSQTE
ncbi:phosphoribosyltransferase-like protein [Xanthomonas sacchari]|uniref:phosphoribosyltransferase-like protein n=1 Tax=Xanthomonas sacchari TaxID=56458 RepID=UPI002434F6F8|nr:hypothetical protein [Xanthomonas sacchari]